MKILFLTWKCKQNPLAGGAEVVNNELAARLAEDRHEVTFVVAGFPGAKAEEEINGYKVIRVGNRWTVYFKAYRYYKKNLKGWADLVIDEVNTMPFFAKFYAREKNILFIHQLCRQIWVYEMFWPLSWLGFVLEPLYLRLINDRKVITVSDSTKKDLLRYGFREKNIAIISEGIDLAPLVDFVGIRKYEKPTLLCFGSVRAMKRTHLVIEAFRLAKRQIPDLRLIIAGDMSGKYGEKIERLVWGDESIVCLGAVTK